MLCKKAESATVPCSRAAKHLQECSQQASCASAAHHTHSQECSRAVAVPGLLQEMQRCWGPGRQALLTASLEQPKPPYVRVQSL